MEGQRAGLPIWKEDVQCHGEDGPCWDFSALFCLHQCAHCPLFTYTTPQDLFSELTFSWPREPAFFMEQQALRARVLKVRSGGLLYINIHKFHDNEDLQCGPTHSPLRNAHYGESRRLPCVPYMLCHAMPCIAHYGRVGFVSVALMPCAGAPGRAAGRH